MACLVAAIGVTAPGNASAAPKHPTRATDRSRAEHALQRVRELKAGRGLRSGRELTPALAELAARRRALGESEEREADRLLARPTDGADDRLGDGYPPSATVATHESANFRVHYVTSGNDAPPAGNTNGNSVPDYVEAMAAEFEASRAVENGTLGWIAPKSDGSRGGNSKTDVYIKDVGNDGIFGYAAPEQNSRSSFAYLVMDDDYGEFGFADPLDALRVTAAHEYNHILQFTYDSFQDLWMLESTATWAEEKVYPAINDYLHYVNASPNGWRLCTELPLTKFRTGNPCATKQYGSAVWNHWITTSRGDEVVRAAWERSDVTSPEPDFAPDAYDEAVKADGGSGFSDEFDRFSAAVAEWRAPGSPFPDRTNLEDAERRGSTFTIDGAAQTFTLDHTTFTLVNVTPDSSKSVAQLQANVPSGLSAAIALVGRTGGDPEGGAVTTRVTQLPSGGTGGVVLDNPGAFARITAVLVNADPSHAGFAGADWFWTRDAQPFTNVRVVGTATPPTSPGGGNGGSTGATTSTTTTVPALLSRLGLHSRQRRSTVLRRGLLAAARCNRACRVRFEVRLDRRTARRLGLPVVIGARSSSLSAAGVKNVRVRLSPRARRRLGRVRAIRMTVRMRARQGPTRGPLLSRRVGVRR